jgi:hypothetical protein
MIAAACDHDGRCSGRLRQAPGRLLREVVCDDCDAVVEILTSVAHTVEPKLGSEAA